MHDQNSTLHSRSASSSGISCASGPSTPIHPPNQHLYRYDPLGLIIYDSHSRLLDELPIESVPLTPRHVSSSDRKELESALDYGKCHPDRSQYLKSPTYFPTKPRICDYTLIVPADCLRFDSHFESGNLNKVVKVSEFEYHLYLETDVNTCAHTQWYHFSVKNMKQGQVVKFCIENLTKPESLYKVGMQPMVFSRVKEDKDKIKWHRAGTEVSYIQNLTLRPDKSAHFHTLSFIYRFEYSGDTVWFAHCYPYTFTDLKADLSLLEVTAPENTLRIDSLCYTLAGNECPLLTITNQVSDLVPWEIESMRMQKSAAARRLLRMRGSRSDDKRKKAVILTGRVHPGESNSSFMLKGAIEFLLSSHRDAQLLRQFFTFRIIPMLNPDGVVYGNSRCNLLGVDLNRRWTNPNQILHPTIYHAKKLIRLCAEDQEVAMYCDFHGHSVKKNAFIYGCVDFDSKRNAFIQLIPLLMQQANKLFSFQDSHFRIEKDKEATARVVTFREMGILNSYTLEASFCGPKNASALSDPESQDPNHPASMTQIDFSSLGKDLCCSLLMLLSPGLFRRKLIELTSFLRGTKPAAEETESESPETKALSLDTALKAIAEQVSLAEVLKASPETVDNSSDASDTEEEQKEVPDTETQVITVASSPVRVRNKSSVRPGSTRPMQNRLPSRPQTCNKRVAKGFDDSLVSNQSSTVASEPPTLTLETIQKQVSRMYTMLRYYKEAGCRLSNISNQRHHQPDVSVSLSRHSCIPQLKVRQSSALRAHVARQKSLRGNRQVKSAKETEEPSFRFLEQARRSSQFQSVSKSWVRS